ncbi:hypothetical protein SDC9_88766 [bioreactor metagenome]|uniref:Uncharacterized protein n=1 Tax=bioreactor metagenome TaxID=1076179 RepID=A0A644ZX03_9ZZZZ
MALLKRKRARFAEHVTESRQPFLCHARQNFRADKLHICVRIPRVLRRHGVCAHIGRHNVKPRFVFEPRQNAELFELVLQIQPVAALGFGCRYTKRELFADKPLSALKQRVLAERARLAHGVEDTAAGLENLQIACAFQLERNFMLPPAAEHKVRMRVHPAGRAEAALRVQFFRVLRAGRNRAAFRNRADNAAVQQDAGISILAVFALFSPSSARCAERRLQQPDVFNQQHGATSTR